MSGKRSLVVRPQTRKRCERAVSSFLRWLGQTSQASPHTFDDLDEAVGNWFDVLYQEGDSIGSAGDGISGLQYFSVLAIDAVFLFSWRVLGVWRKNVLLAQAPPFTELILSGLVGLPVGPRDYEMAAALALGFHCYLRSGQIFAIHKTEIFVNGTPGALFPASHQGRHP